MPASSGAYNLKTKVFTLFFLKWKSKAYRFKRYKKIRLKQCSMVPSVYVSQITLCDELKLQFLFNNLSHLDLSSAINLKEAKRLYISYIPWIIITSLVLQV